MSAEQFLIISDGACSGNPGPGGWGLIFVAPDGMIREFGGHEDQTTNNRMELMGYYQGLQRIYKYRDQFPHCRVLHAISDSKYVLDGAKSFAPRWEKTGWKTTAGTEVKNQDMWEKVLKGQKMLQEAGFRFEYELVKGHAGHAGNERVDEIAVRYVREEPIKLYEGPSAQYEVSLHKLEPFAKCYLSYVGGVLKKHKTWDECKSVVDGKPGAKFKKVSSAAEERETLAAWGLKQ